MQPFLVKNFLPEDVFQKIRDFVATLEFQDGVKTARGKAKEAKNNLQAQIRHPKEHLMQSNISSFFMNSDLFQNFLYARKVTPPLINKYQIGMAYNQHIDRSLMRDVRTDYSFTYFLTDPQDYQGGELQINANNQTMTFKGEANSIVVYEALHKHLVSEVRAGERVSIVGWIESFIASEEKKMSIRALQGIQHQLKDNLDEQKLENIQSELNLQIQKILRFFAD